MHDLLPNRTMNRPAVSIYMTWYTHGNTWSGMMTNIDIQTLGQVCTKNHELSIVFKSAGMITI